MDMRKGLAPPQSFSFLMHVRALKRVLNLKITC